MIKLKSLLLERMSFRDLYNNSDAARISRADDVRSKSLRVFSKDDGNEAWSFSYKSNPSTTKQRHRGEIRFFKDNISEGSNFLELDCQVDCSCPDYRYRWAFNNNKQDAAPIGNNSLNKNNGNVPIPANNLGPGLCKHLAALSEYLKTNIEPTAPSPKDASTLNVKKDKKPEQQKNIPTTAPKPTIDAPNPEKNDPYSGMELEENNINEDITSKINSFIKSHPQFEVNYL